MYVYTCRVPTYGVLYSTLLYSTLLFSTLHTCDRLVISSNWNNWKLGHSKLVRHVMQGVLYLLTLSKPRVAAGRWLAGYNHHVTIIYLLR